MKTLFLFCFLILSLSFSMLSYAQGCGAPCTTEPCIEPESPCDCTDPGWRWDNCISRGIYCAAFGNVGGLEE